MQALESVSTLRKKGIISTGNFPESATLSAVATGSELPAVQVYKMNTNPPIFAIVYTDSNGTSSFSYKNDPNNRIKLVQNGSRIDPLVSGASPTGTVVQESSLVCNYCGGRVDPGCPPQMAACATSQQSEGGILGAICWCLSCMSSIGFVCFIGFIVYMALKKQP
jgi:hypothetical protein